MKNRVTDLRSFLFCFCLSVLLLGLNACTKKEEADAVDPSDPGLAVAGMYTISYYNANGTEYDAAKVGAIGTLSVTSSGKEFVTVDQTLAIKNTNIFNPFPASMRVIKNGTNTVALQTFDSKPLGTISNDNLELKIVDAVYTTTIRAKKL